jgi:hypothetical protein
VLQLKVQYVSSQEITLTDEHISMLEQWTPKFRAADLSHREKMINKAANYIESTWAESMEFDRDAVTGVRDLSAKLGYPKIFLAHSPVSVWQS